MVKMPATARAGSGTEGGDPRLHDTTAQLLTGGGVGATTVAAPTAGARDTMAPGTRQHIATAAAAAISQRLIGAMCSRLSLPQPWRVTRGFAVPGRHPGKTSPAPDAPGQETGSAALGGRAGPRGTRHRLLSPGWTRSGGPAGH